MSYSIFISALAKRHLKEAYNWYESQQLFLGKEFRKEVNDYFIKLLEGNVDYHRYNDTIRKVKLQRFPYCIYYEREEHRVAILAVLHIKLDPDKIKSMI